MDSPQKKLGSAMEMDGKTPHQVPGTLSVTVGVAEKTLPPVSARANAWAYLNALVFLGSHISGLAIYYVLNQYLDVPCSQSFFFLRCYQLTDAEATEEAALQIVMECCAAFQLAVAALALAPAPRSHEPGARAHHRRPLHVCRRRPPLPRRQPRGLLLLGLLHRGHRLLRGGRHRQLAGHRPGRSGVEL